MFPFFTYDDSEIRLIRGFVFGETDILIETERRVFDGEISDVRIKLAELLYKLLREIEKIIPFHMIEIPVLIHPIEIIILFDRCEESER